ncbi:MAG: response regulator [Myxococcales bacterium]|nr:response regulator [Myxococcales bacterium]
MRILIVEDSVTMRKVMEMTFAGEDAELLVVENGELALERGAAFAPDVAFIDSSLPGIDGYEVTRALKGDPGLSSTAVVLMASQHRPLDSARASEVGADDHILKPFDTQEAIDKANALTGQTKAPSFSDMPSIPVARPATTPPRPVAQRGQRPTPPPLPASPGMQPAAQRLSGTPISGAQVSVTPTSAPSLHSSAPPAKIVSAPAPDPSSAPPSQFSSAPPGQFSSAPPARVPSAPPARVPSASPSSPLEAAGASEALSHSVVARLETLGLTPDQVEGVLKLSAEVVERVVWEVVPDLAEAMIREELHRLIGD